jgi:hypothetical protein
VFLVGDAAHQARAIEEDRKRERRREEDEPHSSILEAHVPCAACP